jgi:glyoxylase-like metal-dependent hydrolase (beta-lactamase superfamily II)/rhodanese-related sulfurtransferase
MPLLPSVDVIFRQFVDDDLGCASYLVGDESAGEAVVVDPAYAIEPYLAEAGHHGVRIVRVLETHTHADHVSGHGRFALEHGASVGIHPAAEPEYPFEPLEDGQTIELGSVCLRVVHTPGHRPEHCCFAVSDRSRADEPWFVLTGDSLFIGDVARPDLAVAAVDGARHLYHSLDRLLGLPDGVEVYPGHVAGSLCGIGMSSKASSTIGFERRFNRALALADELAFVDETARMTAPRPPTMEPVVELNRGPFVGRPQSLQPLESAANATVLDVRPARVFAAGHVPGAINVPVSGSSFATKAGFVLTFDERIAVHASGRAEAEEAARGLRSVGFLELEGYLVEAPAWATLDPVSIGELDDLLADEAVEILDVRERDERSSGYIAGSRHVPWRLLRGCAADFADGVPVVTICETGARAAIAASILAASGIDARPVLDGGVPDWQAQGNHTVEFRRCGS